MMRKAGLAMRKVNVDLDGPGCYLVAGSSLICSLSAFSLAKEDQVSDNAYQYYGHDNQLLQVFRIKEPRRNCGRCGDTMTAMMIDD